MRTFIAIDIRNDRISRVLGELKAIDGVKTVEHENLHLTLKFLGEIDERQIDGIHKAMAASLQGHVPFEISLEGAGAFPKLNSIRVVWVGVEKNRDLIIEIQKRLEQNLSKLGFKKDRRFHPHITIARVKSRKRKDGLKDFILRHQDERFGDFMINKIKLKKSILTPKGPIYSSIREVELQAGQ